PASASGNRPHLMNRDSGWRRFSSAGANYFGGAATEAGGEPECLDQAGGQEAHGANDVPSGNPKHLDAMRGEGPAVAFSGKRGTPGLVYGKGRSAIGKGRSEAAAPPVREDVVDKPADDGRAAPIPGRIRRHRDPRVATQERHDRVNVSRLPGLDVPRQELLLARAERRDPRLGAVAPAEPGQTRPRPGEGAIRGWGRRLPHRGPLARPATGDTPA